jgi:hypothetical protein
MPFDGGRVWPLSQRTTRYVRISSCERPEADSALPLGIQEPEVLMANDPKTDEAQGKRDTEGRPVLTDKDEKKRQEEESKEKPVDPE